MSRNLILDNMENPYITKQSQKWYFVSDQIMGGVSSGKFQLEEIDSCRVIGWLGKYPLKIMEDLFKLELN